MTLSILPKSVKLVLNLVSQEKSNSSSIVWSSEFLVAIVAVVGSFISAIIITRLSHKHLLKLEHEKNSLERYNQIASLIAHYYHLTLIIDKKESQDKKDSILIEINRVLTELALWLPKDIYNKIFKSISNPANFGAEYPLIINNIREYFKLQSIDDSYLSLVYVEDEDLTSEPEEE